MPRAAILAKSIPPGAFSGLATRTGRVAPGKVFGQAPVPLGVVMSERRNPNPHPSRLHLDSLTRHLRASHARHRFDGVPQRQTCSEARVHFSRKAAPLATYISVPLQLIRPQSACDSFAGPDSLGRQGCVVSVVCDGDVVPSIA
jgi:hypothetical protein